MNWCCGLFSWDLVPHSYNELTTEELRQLYTFSTKINGGRLIVQGLFARADAKNTNGRVYPKSILQREVARFLEQHVRRGTALGELNHPSYYSSYFRRLNLPNISHHVLDLRWRGPELWGIIEILPTPAGLLLSELYSKGVKLGVSSRGWASVAKDPRNQQIVVDPDYQLITFDFVPEPSNAGAYVVPICRRYRKRLPDQSNAVSMSFLGIGSSSMAQLHQLPLASALRKWLKHTSKAMELAAKHPGQATVTKVNQATAASTPRSFLQPPPCAASAAAEACSSSSAERGSLCKSGSGGSSGSCHPAAVSLLEALGDAGRVLPADTPLGGGVLLGCHYQVLDKPWLPVDSAVRQFKTHLSLMATKARLHQQQQGHRQQQEQQQQQQAGLSHSGGRSQQVPLATMLQKQQLLHEQPLLQHQDSHASSSSSQAQQVATGGSDQPIAPGALLQIACNNDEYSDSSLGPGTPKAAAQLLGASAPASPLAASASPAGRQN